MITLLNDLDLFRNNLTVIEPVVVYGRGARIGMRVENMEARSKQPLLFEIRHDHLSDCNNPKRKYLLMDVFNYESVTSRMSFLRPDLS